MSARTRWSIAIAAGALALACETTPAPRDALAQAEEAIARARARDADQYAPLKLREAEDKLEKARNMARDDDQRVTARRVAEEAQVDAELALAQSERAQAELNVQEMERTVRALDREIDHELD
jgi:hypothetical protein